jgi:hypothetical protein
MAQRSLLLPAMAVTAVLGAVAAAVVIAGNGETASRAAAPPVTVTLPATTGDASSSAGATGGQTDPGSGDQGGLGGQDGQGSQQQGGQGQDDQGDNGPVVVPSLVGMRLDDASAALATANLAREIDGGGLFGVVDDTAWMVCDTTPEAGTEVAPGEVVVVHVDRSC